MNKYGFIPVAHQEHFEEHGGSLLDDLDNPAIIYSHPVHFDCKGLFFDNTDRHDYPLNSGLCIEPQEISIGNSDSSDNGWSFLHSSAALY
jgi:hypothetical protein